MMVDVTPEAVLQFIADRHDKPSNVYRESWPEWSKVVDKALSRYKKETDDGRRLCARSDASVSSRADAIQHWVYLPLIREALGRK